MSGISERILVQTLQQLESNGSLTRQSYLAVPPRVDYTLTPLGARAAKLIESLADWVEANMLALIG